MQISGRTEKFCVAVEGFLRMTRKWLEGAAGLRQETVTKSFTKSAGKRADELISGSIILIPETETN